MGPVVPGAPAGRWEGCSLCSGIHFFPLVALWGTPELPKGAGTVLRGAPGAFPGLFFGFSKAPRTLFRRSGRVFPGLPIVSEAVWGVAEMIGHGFTVRRDICGWNLRAPLSIADCMGLLFGVGGSGRSPVEFWKRGFLCCSESTRPVQPRSTQPPSPSPKRNSADPEGPARGEAWQGR